MSTSRRAFLQTLSLLALQGSRYWHGGALAAVLGLVNERGTSTSAVGDAVSFGIDQRLQVRDHRSFYSVPVTTSPQNRLCFDVSNNRIACSVNAHGLLERFVAQLGVLPNEAKGTPSGAYIDKVLLRTGPFPVSVAVGNAPAIRLDELDQPEVYLEDNLLPRYEWTIGDLKLKMLVFAPQTDSKRPRTICTQWIVRTSDNSATSVVKLFIGTNPPAVGSSIEQATTQFLAWQTHGGWFRIAPNIAVDVATEIAEPTTVAITVGLDEQEVLLTEAELTSLSATTWLQATRGYHRSRYGTLTIPEAPFYSELYVRAAELTRQSLMLDTQGQFGGSFNGSDLPAASNVWLRDCFYSALPQCFLSPDLSRLAIFFFLQWSIPSRPIGEHFDRFPSAAGVTNSLGNTAAGIVLAGIHYANNGDKEFFLQHPEILTRSVQILEQVLASRREEAFLFPSIYVSDGESRGDFHTGSNIFLWRAFCSLARLAEEVYGKPELASIWRWNASRLREAILTNCVVVEDGGNRFVEGAMQDHTKIGGHDAEESDVTLAAFYEFCEQDDEAYLNAAREAISPSNPYAIKEAEGIWWYAHGKWSSATFPGWTTALASSTKESEFVRHLERIRTLTDADGSFWWWPYQHDLLPKIEHPLRTNSKCGWAAGVYVCYFTRHILGLSVDMPKHRVNFRPFLPWPDFSWKDCRLGGLRLDCSYIRREGEITMAIHNQTGAPLDVFLEAILPEGATFVRSIAQDVIVQSHAALRYSRTAAQFRVKVPPREHIAYKVEFEPKPAG